MSASAYGATAQALDDRFVAQGVAMVEYALSAADLAMMTASFPDLDAGPKLKTRSAGARADAFSAHAHELYSTHTALLALAGRLLRTEARLSRLQAFDKSASVNWFVPWHQDRAEDGHERDVAVLERTLALRIHLDDCDETNGPLEVVPGTHTLGRLDAAAIQSIVADAPTLVCLAVRGDIVALRPLIVHRSQRAQHPAARRVVHIEFTAV